MMMNARERELHKLVEYSGERDTEYCEQLNRLSQWFSVALPYENNRMEAAQEACFRALELVAIATLPEGYKLLSEEWEAYEEDDEWDNRVLAEVMRRTEGWVDSRPWVSRDAMHRMELCERMAQAVVCLLHCKCGHGNYLVCTNDEDYYYDEESAALDEALNVDTETELGSLFSSFSEVIGNTYGLQCCIINTGLPMQNVTAIKWELFGCTQASLHTFFAIFECAEMGQAATRIIKARKKAMTPPVDMDQLARDVQDQDESVQERFQLLRQWLMLQNAREVAKDKGETLGLEERLKKAEAERDEAISSRDRLQEAVQGTLDLCTRYEFALDKERKKSEELLAQLREAQDRLEEIKRQEEAMQQAEIEAMRRDEQEQYRITEVDTYNPYDEGYECGRRQGREEGQQETLNAVCDIIDRDVELLVGDKFDERTQRWKGAFCNFPFVTDYIEGLRRERES